MNFIRRSHFLHPLLLASWSVLHSLAALSLLALCVMPPTDSWSNRIVSAFPRVRAIANVPQWLPDNLFAAICAAWLALVVSIYLASYCTRWIATRYAGDDVPVTAIRTLARSSRIRLLIAILAVLTLATLFERGLVVALIIACTLVATIGVYRPHLAAGRLPSDLPSIWLAVKGFLWLVVGLIVSMSWLFAKARVATSLAQPFLGAVGVLSWLVDWVLAGAIFLLSTFGVRRFLDAFTSARLLSPRYLATWFRLDYIAFLATMWLTPPIWLGGMFLTWCSGGIAPMAQVVALSPEWWLAAFSQFAWALQSGYGFAVVPVLLVAVALVGATIVFELEQCADNTDTGNPSGADRR